MPESTSEEELLTQTAITCRQLLDRFASTLSKDSQTSNLDDIEHPPDALSVVSDSAKLIKAYTTKLQLLVITPPFTPSAIRKILQELMNPSLPALMSAYEICRSQTHSELLHKELKLRLRRLFVEMQGMVTEVLERVRLLGESKTCQSNSKQGGHIRDPLPTTGVVWDACESLMDLKEAGVVGLILQKAQQWRSLLVDAIDELKEWSDGSGDTSNDDDDDATSFDENGSMDIFGGSDRLPADRPDLKASLEKTIKKMRLVSTLYQALINRRFKNSPPVDNVSATPRSIAFKTDKIAGLLRCIPEKADEVAGAYYELDRQKAQSMCDSMVSDAKLAATLLTYSWDAKEDKFTEWSKKWLQAVEAPDVGWSE